MKKTIKQIILLLMVMLLGLSVVAPVASATEQLAASNVTGSSVVSNDNTLYIYVGLDDELYVTESGVRQDPLLYRWKSSKPSVVSITKLGIITGKKVGKAVITATRKSTGKKLSVIVEVKQNKVDKLKSKPSATAAPYKGIIIRLKSVEIASLTKVIVEYYLACNFPSNWTLSKLRSVEDAINLFDRSTGSYVATIVGDDYQLWASSIKGFRPRKGKSVQVIKAIYSGSRVHCSNVLLSNYLVDDSSNAKINYEYRY